MVTFTDRDDRRSAHLHNRAIQNANAVRERRATLENPDWLMSRPADWYTELDTQGEPSNWRAAKNVLQHRPAVTTDMNEQRNMFQMLANQAKGGDRGARLIDTRDLPAGARRTGRTMFQDPSRAQGFLGDVGSLFSGNNRAAVYADEYNPFPKAGFGEDWYKDKFKFASGLGSLMEGAENFIPGATWAKQFLPKSKRLPLERDLSWVPEGLGEYDKLPVMEIDEVSDLDLFEPFLENAPIDTAHLYPYHGRGELSEDFDYGQFPSGVDEVDDSIKELIYTDGIKELIYTDGTPTGYNIKGEKIIEETPALTIEELKEKLSSGEIKIETGIIDFEPSSVTEENNIIQDAVEKNPWIMSIMGNDYKYIRGWLWDLGVLNPNSDMYKKTDQLEQPE